MAGSETASVPKKRLLHHRPHRIRSRKPRGREPGAAPGTFHFDDEAPPSKIYLIAYDENEIEEHEIRDPAEIGPFLNTSRIVWINVNGLGQGEEIHALGDLLKLHTLALEDAVNLGQRAKVEPYDQDLFIVGRMPIDGGPDTEQLSMFVGKKFVLTIQETPGDPFDAVRARLRNGRPRIRSRGPDYLAYALLDALIDSYFPVLDAIGDELEQLEERVLERPTQETVTHIHAARRTLIGLRKAVGPHREAFNVLLRDDSPFITQETSLFLRDVYDHTIRIVEFVETYREITTDLMSTYLSALSNRMNEIMKVLTIIATIFIPLGFIAGLYGMNFDPDTSPLNMPELGWYYGYPFALGLMAAVALGFLVYMWRRGWLR